MEIKGKIKLINAEVVVSDKYKKREFVLITGETYPQELLIQTSQAKCSLLDSVSVGQEVTVHINLRGRAWTNPQGEVKYFNSIEGWKIDGGTAPVIGDVIDNSKPFDDLPY